MTKHNLKDELVILASALKEIQKKENDEINFFDAVNMAGQEIRHSAFFAWLFDSSKPHGLGNKVLKVFFKHLYLFEKNANILGKLDVNGSLLEKASDSVTLFSDLVQGETETERERDHIDILIRIPETETVVVVENKTGTLPHDDQLIRYSDTVAEKYPKYKKIFVYMAVTDEPPINHGGKNDMQVNEDYCKFTYREFLAVLDEVKTDIPKKTIKGQKLTIILEDYKKMVTNNLLHENPGAYATCEEIMEEHKEAIEALDAYRNSATTEKVLQYCKDFFGATTVEDARQFMTQKMEDVFAGEKHSNLKSLFHIVLMKPSKDGKTGFVLKIELEKRQKNGAWSPTQTRIIKALETAGMVPLDHKDSTVGVYISGKNRSMEILTAKERMEPFADVQPILDQRLTEFKKTVIALENVLATLTPVSPVQP